VNEVIESHVRSLTGDRRVDRRTFVVTSLGAGFAAFALPVPAQTITTSAEGLVAGEVKVKTPDGEMPAYRAMPATGSNFPVVLVVSEVWGVHEYIKDVCRRWRRTATSRSRRSSSRGRATRRATPTRRSFSPRSCRKASDKQVLGDLDACVAFAKDSGKAETTRLGITGFCWGGRVVYMYAAHNPKVKAGVAWYGATTRAFFQGDKTELDVAARSRRRCWACTARRTRAFQRDGREDVRGAQVRRQHEVAVHAVPRHAARVPRGLPPELSQGSRPRTRGTR
jgi:dienelactone hydrolase